MNDNGVLIMRTFKIYFTYCETFDTAYHNWQYTYEGVEADTPAQAIKLFKKKYDSSYLVKNGGKYKIETIDWCGMQDDEIVKLVDIEKRKLPEKLA